MTGLDTRATQDFTAVLHLPLPPEELLALFTSPAGVSRWWGPAFGDAEVGGTLVVHFGDHGANAVRVLAAGPDRVVWQPVQPVGVRTTPHTAEWLGTALEFELVPETGGTELRFRHAGLTERLACWDDCHAGWTYFLASIDRLARTGVGTPFGA